MFRFTPPLPEVANSARYGPWIECDLHSKNGLMYVKIKRSVNFNVFSLTNVGA